MASDLKKKSSAGEKNMLKTEGSFSSDALSFCRQGEKGGREVTTLNRSAFGPGKAVEHRGRGNSKEKEVSYKRELSTKKDACLFGFSLLEEEKNQGNKVISISIIGLSGKEKAVKSGDRFFIGKDGKGNINLTLSASGTKGVKGHRICGARSWHLKVKEGKGSDRKKTSGGANKIIKAR